MIEWANRSKGMPKAAAPPVYRPCSPAQRTGNPGATPPAVAFGHGTHIPGSVVGKPPIGHSSIRTACSAAPATGLKNATNILQRAAAPRSVTAPTPFGPPVYKPAPSLRNVRVVQLALGGAWGGVGRHLAALSGSAGDVFRNSGAVPPPLPPAPLTTFPASKTDFTAGEIETLFAEGQLTLGAPARYDSLNLDGVSYSQNYSYTLSYAGRVISVLHIHYDTNNPSDVRTATIGLVKIKKGHWDRAVVAYAASAGLIAAARAKH